MTTTAAPALKKGQTATGTKPSPAPIMLRPFLYGEKNPTSQTAPKPRCRFCKSSTNIKPLFKARLPMHPEWDTCLECAQLGRRAQGLCREFDKANESAK